MYHAEGVLSISEERKERERVPPIRALALVLEWAELHRGLSCNAC